MAIQVIINSNEVTKLSDGDFVAHLDVENLVDIYENEYIEAKKNHDAKRVHIKRSCISQYKAKIRYWLSHHE